MNTFTERRTLVLGVYQTMQQPLTDREVKDLLEFTDMNAVRPRITELLIEGKLKETGSTICNTTGRNVRLCEVA